MEEIDEIKKKLYKIFVFYLWYDGSGFTDNPAQEKLASLNPNWVHGKVGPGWPTAPYKTKDELKFALPTQSQMEEMITGHANDAQQREITSIHDGLPGAINSGGWLEASADREANIIIVDKKFRNNYPHFEFRGHNDIMLADAVGEPLLQYLKQIYDILSLAFNVLHISVSLDGGGYPRNRVGTHTNRKKKKTKRSQRKSKKLTKKKYSPKYRVSVKIDNFSNRLYQYFKRMKLNPKHNFINFTTKLEKDKIKFLFTSHINHKYNSNPLWEDIHCKELILSDTMIIKTECDRMEKGKPVKDRSITPDRSITHNRSVPGFYKVFVKGYHNLYEYIQSIKKNKTTKKDHQLLFDKILQNQLFLNDRSLINHNLDVKTLHFKFS